MKNITITFYASDDTVIGDSRLLWTGKDGNLYYGLRRVYSVTL